jgi:outer membrane protein assembly factor BamB
MSSPVVDGAVVYGFSNKRKGQLFCLDAKTGTVKWTTEGRGGANAALQSAGGNLLVLTTDGELIVAKRHSEKFEELHRYTVADSETWAQPVLLKDAVIIRTADAVTRWGV